MGLILKDVSKTFVGKKAVESMTGLKVEEVNVHVQGVNTDTASDNEEKSEADD